MTGLTPAAIDRAASLFAKARLERGIVDGLPPELAPTNIAEAYAIQAKLAETLGWAVGGWFCGCTNRAIQEQLGLIEPYCAPLFRHLIHQAPAVLDARDFAPIVLECEFSFILARDLPARSDPYELDEVKVAIATLHPSIEVVAGTLKDWRRQPPFTIIADNGVDGALVLGEGMRDWSALDLASIPVELSVDGEPVQTGSGVNVLGNPLDALLWLANEQRKRGNGLKAGDVCNTGTATLMQPITAGQHAVASFGPLGSAELRLV
ncbi:MAG: 2-keto-4-pentenoate hydratase [Pseudomonadota bacterium]